MPRNRNVRRLSSGGFEHYVEPDDQWLARQQLRAMLTVGGGILLAIGFQDKYVDLSQTSEARTGHARCPLHQ